MELRKEYEEIRSRAIQGLCVPANKVTVGTVIDAVREAVTACQALADRPMKELTDAEIHNALFACGPYSTPAQASRAVIAAHIAKQHEPEVVKFRAARNLHSGEIDLFGVAADGSPKNEYFKSAHWEWLEPAQEFEVKV